MLILFDIDGTLLLTDRAGSKAMQEAGKREVGDAWDLSRVEFAGGMDALIFAKGARLAGVEPDDALHRRFRSAYSDALRRRLEKSPMAHALPGVDTLLTRLRAENGVTLGLLTGNYPETGAIKLAAAGIDRSWFEVAAWGDEGGHRRALPLVAMARHEARTGTRVDPARVVIVGDTIHDIDCAHANGCLAVAVATGPAYCDRDELAARNPDLMLDDLTDADAFLQFLDAHRG